MRKLAAISLCLCLAFSLIQTVYGADRSLDRLYVEDQSFNYGRGSSDSTNGGSLAWSETYVLDGYLNAYETTNDKAWLDESVTHLDRMIASAVDPDGDTYKGWPDGLYAHKQLNNSDFDVFGADPAAAEVLLNPSFELDANADGVPDQWTRQGNPAQTYRSTTGGDSYSGSAGVIIESDGTNENRLVQNLSLTAGKRYVLEAYVGVQTEKTQARLEIFNATTNVVLAYTTIHHIGFEKQLLNFNAPASGTIQLRLGLQSYTEAGYKARFDLASIKQVPNLPLEVVKNPIMETLTAGDATMPANWTRSPGATSSHIYTVTGINNYHTGLRGLAITTDNTTDKVAEQTLAYTPSQEYILTYWGKVSDPKYQGKVEIYNVTDSQVLASSTFSNTRWDDQRVKFIAPATSGKTLQVRLYQETSDNIFTTYFDQVSVKPVIQYEAAGWSRNVPLANAHGTNSADVNPSALYGLELIHGGGIDPVLSQPLSNFRPNSNYLYKAEVKVTPGATGGMSIYNVTTGSVIAQTTFTNSAYSRLKLEFTTPSVGDEVRVDIYMISGTSGQKLHAYSLLVAEQWEHQVHEGNIGAVMLRFANKVYADASLTAAYQTKADTYRDFVADHLFHKWDGMYQQISGTDGSNNGKATYLFPAGFSTEWFPTRSLPANMNMAYARMLYELYDATDGVAKYASDRPLYISRANDLARGFKDTLRPHSLNTTLGIDAYEWNYWSKLGAWDDGHYVAGSADDLSHAATTITGIIAAFRHTPGIFSVADMQRIARTMTDVMWNGSLTDPVIAYYMHRQPAATVDKERSYLSHHWIDLAEFDRNIYNIADALCKEELCMSYTASALGLWSRNHIVNNGFELNNLTNTTLPLYWTRWQSSPATAYLDTTAPYLGTKSLTIKTNGLAWQVMEHAIPEYEPNSTYTVTFAGNTNGNVGGRVDVYDFTSSTLLARYDFTNTSWSTHSFTFATPAAAGHNVKFRLYHNSYTIPNGIAYFDEIRALPYLYNSEVPNGGFETKDRFDATLPRFWQRSATTLESNVRIDTTAFKSGEGSLRLSTDVSGAAQELSYNLKGYKTSSSYQLRVQGKTNGSSAGGRVKVIDTSNGTVLADLNVTAAAWTNYSVNFTTPSDYTKTLKVLITHDNPAIAGGEFWVDDLGITLN